MSATPVTIRLSSTTERTPIRAMSQPLNGPDRPKTTRPAAAANDTDAVDQPGSSVIVRRNAPGRRAHPGRHEHDHGRDGDHDPPVEERPSHQRMLPVNPAR